MTRLLERHFATEDAHMAAHPYAGAAAHRADHERALETALSLAAHLDGQSLALGIRFLYDWLLSHIRSYDAELPRGADAPGNGGLRSESNTLRNHHDFGPSIR